MLVASHACACSINLEAYLWGGDYVCDLTEPRLHYDHTGAWMEAAPEQGSGCHEYAVFEGETPKGCKVGKRCKACAKPPGKKIRSAHIEFADNGVCGFCGKPCFYCYDKKPRERAPTVVPEGFDPQGSNGMDADGYAHYEISDDNNDGDDRNSWLILNGGAQLVDMDLLPTGRSEVPAEYAEWDKDMMGTQ